MLSPSVGLRAIWQVSKLNTIQLQTGISYTKYLSHPQLDTRTLLLSPDSEIRFNLYLGDFLITFRDQFSIQQDPVTESSVSGVASIGRVTNTAGVTVLWDLNDVIASLRYDHLTFTTTGATTITGGTTTSRDVSFLDRTTDQVSAVIAFRTGMSALTGVESTLGTTHYRTGQSQDYSSMSVGPFFNLQLTRYTSFQSSAGYRRFFSDSTGTADAAASGTGSTLSSESAGAGSSDGGSFYGNLAIVHRLNRYYADRLVLARDSQVGLFSERTDINSIAYSSAWTLGRQLTLSTGLVYQDIHQVTGPLGTAQSANFGLFSGSLGTNYNLTKHLNLSLGYQLTIRLAGDSTQGYSQNRMRIGFQYQF